MLEQVIGRAKEENPAKSLDHSCRLVEMFRSRPRPLCPFRKLDSQKKGYLGPHEFENMLRTACKVEISSSEANDLFFKMVTPSHLFSLSIITIAT